MYTTVRSFIATENLYLSAASSTALLERPAKKLKNWYTESMDEKALFEAHRDILLDFAKKYIWWESPEAVMPRPYRFLASAMNIGILEDYQHIRQEFDPKVLSDLLKNAEPGWFSERSWSFWHRVLELVDVNETVPPPPERIWKNQLKKYSPEQWKVSWN